MFKKCKIQLELIRKLKKKWTCFDLWQESRPRNENKVQQSGKENKIEATVNSKLEQNWRKYDIGQSKCATFRIDINDFEKVHGMLKIWSEISDEITVEIAKNTLNTATITRTEKNEGITFIS